MKKPLSLLLTVIMLCSVLAVFAVPVSAKTSSKITVEVIPNGQDTYSDGTPVLDDEIYAIVWTKSPDTQVNFDETFKSTDDMKVLVNAPMAKDGCCPRIQFHFDESYYRENSLDTGYFRLFSTNVLRRKENNTIPFEIRETKVTAGNNNNIHSSPLSGVPGSSPIDLTNPTVIPPNPTAVTLKVDKFALVGDWAITYLTYTSGENQNVSLILIQPKGGTVEFYKMSHGSIFSEGNLWIIAGVAGILIGMAVMFLIMKKKKPVAADTAAEEKLNEENEE